MRDVSARVSVGSRWDRAGIAISLACGVHCFLLPLLTGLVPLVGLRPFADERVEWIFITATATVGFITHTRAYIRHHKHAAPGLLFVAGLLLIVVARGLRLEGLADPVCAAIAGVFTITAHGLNLRLCRCCPSCFDDACAARQDG